MKIEFIDGSIVFIAEDGDDMLKLRKMSSKQEGGELEVATQTLSFGIKGVEDEDGVDCANCDDNYDVIQTLDDNCLNEVNLVQTLIDAQNEHESTASELKKLQEQVDFKVLELLDEHDLNDVEKLEEYISKKEKLDANEEDELTD